MPGFTTRVELHDATWSVDYKKLHIEMEKEGFTTVIVSDDTEEYILPPAEYSKKVKRK